MISKLSRKVADFFVLQQYVYTDKMRLNLKERKGSKRGHLTRDKSPSLTTFGS